MSIIDRKKRLGMDTLTDLYNLVCAVGKEVEKIEKSIVDLGSAVTISEKPLLLQLQSQMIFFREEQKEVVHFLLELTEAIKMQVNSGATVDECKIILAEQLKDYHTNELCEDLSKALTEEIGVILSFLTITLAELTMLDDAKHRINLIQQLLLITSSHKNRIHLICQKFCVYIQSDASKQMKKQIDPSPVLPSSASTGSNSIGKELSEKSMQNILEHKIVKYEMNRDLIGREKEEEQSEKVKSTKKSKRMTTKCPLKPKSAKEEPIDLTNS